MARKLRDDKWSAFLDYVFYYCCYLWVPALVLLIHWWRSGALGTGLSVLGLAILALCFYGRFIEPRWLRINKSSIDLTPSGYEGATKSIRIALFSDTHFGIFQNVMPLRRIRKAIEKEAVDLVLVAGDLTNHLRADELEDTFGDFSNFKEPVYAVLGNHDYGLPGWIMPEEIAETLRRHRVNMLENETVRIDIRGASLRLTGLRDHYAGTADYDLLGQERSREGESHIVIAHNADAANDYPHGSKADLTLSGHTHGGQIRLPFVYRGVIPTRHGFDQGLYLSNGYRVYVSSGTGMDVLPVRLFIPPCVDILNLTIASGGSDAPRL